MITDMEAVLDNMKNDPSELICALLSGKDVGEVLKSKGFELDKEEVAALDIYIKKIKTYITDQIHVMELKSIRMKKSNVNLFASRIEAARSGNSAAGNW